MSSILKLSEKVSLSKALYLNELSFTDFKRLSDRYENNDERKEYFEKLKKYTNDLVSNSGEVERGYYYSKSMKSLGRLFSNGVQNVAREIRGFLFGESTTDFDMKNAHPVILRYICRRHNIICPYLTEYILRRDEILKTITTMSREESKKLFLKSVNNDAVNRKQRDPFFRKFDAEMKALHKEIIIIDEYKEICDTVPEEKEYNLSGSKINRILCMYENKILQVALSVIREHNLEISALMFDGCMVYGNHYDNQELLISIADKCNEEFTDLNIEWDYKGHDISISIPEGWKSKKMATMVVEKLELKKDVVEGIQDGDDNQAANIILENYPHWKYCNKELYVFDDETGMWSTNRAIQNNIIGKLSDKLKIVKKTKDGLEFTGRNYANCHNKRKDVYEYIHQKTVDDDWILRSQHTSLGKILFINGYYDFRKSTFTNVFDPAIVFHCRIDHAFTKFNDDDMVYMETIRERLFCLSLGKEVGDYVILNLARGLAGDMMKRIMFGLGMSNTGKGIMTKALQLSCGQYVDTFNAENLAYTTSSSDEAQKLRWAYLLQSKRIIISNEITNDKPLNGNIIKKVCSGGDSLKGRLHGGLETSFIPQFLTCLLANDIPEIKPYDDALMNRVRVYSYTKPFVDEPTNEFELKKDPELEKEMQTLRFQRCFVGMLIMSYLKFNDDDRRVEIEPNEVMMAKKDWMGDDKDNNIMEKFQLKYELTNDPTDFVKSKDIEEWVLSTKDTSYRKFVMEFKKYVVIHKLDHIKNKDKKIGKFVLKGWFGIKIIKECDVEYYEDETDV